MKRKWSYHCEKLYHINLAFLLTACNRFGAGTSLHNTGKCTHCECTGFNTYSCARCATVAQINDQRTEDWPSDFPNSELTDSGLVVILLACSNSCPLLQDVGWEALEPFFRTQKSVKVVDVQEKIPSPAPDAEQSQQAKNLRLLQTFLTVSLMTLTFSLISNCQNCSLLSVLHSLCYNKTCGRYVSACRKFGSGTFLQDTSTCIGCKCKGDNSYFCSRCGSSAVQMKPNLPWDRIW